MKKYAILLICIAFFFACGNDNSTHVYIDDNIDDNLGYDDLPAERPATIVVSPAHATIGEATVFTIIYNPNGTHTTCTGATPIMISAANILRTPWDDDGDYEILELTPFDTIVFALFCGGQEFIIEIPAMFAP